MYVRPEHKFDVLVAMHENLKFPRINLVRPCLPFDNPPNPISVIDFKGLIFPLHSPRHRSSHAQ